MKTPVIARTHLNNRLLQVLIEQGLRFNENTGILTSRQLAGSAYMY